MTVKFFDRARMTTATTGTGTVTLNAPTSAFQSFVAAGVADADSVRYLIEDGGAWEIGTGVYGAVGATMTRTLISSSSGALLALSGNAIVSVIAAAQDIENVANALQKSANLSDVDDAATARANLGLEIGADVQEFVGIPAVASGDAGKQLYVKNDDSGYELPTAVYRHAASFGFVNDGTTDNTAALNSAGTWSAANGGTPVVIPDNSATAKISGALTVPAGAVFCFVGRARLEATGSGTITNNGIFYSIVPNPNTGVGSLYHSFGVFSQINASGTTGAATTAINYIGITEECSDASQATPWIYGFNIAHNFGGGSSSGARSAIIAQLHQTEVNSLSSQYNGHTAVVAEVKAFANEGTSTANAPSYYGLNPYVSLENALYCSNLSGGEFNVNAAAGSTISYRSGIQIAAYGYGRATTTDAAVSLSNVGASGDTWKNGILLGGQNGRAALGSDSTAIATTSAMSFTNGIDFSDATMSGSVLKSKKFDLQESGSANLNVGSKSNTSETPYIDFFTGQTYSGTRLICTPGSGGDKAGSFNIQSGDATFSGIVRPAIDNAVTLGMASLRWSEVYAATGTINTSDANDKENVQTIDPALAEKFLRAIDAKSFKWKDQAQPAVTAKRMISRQKTQTVTVEDTEIVVENEKAVLKKIKRAVVEPVFEDIPIVDENGDPVMDHFPAKYSQPDKKGEKPTLISPATTRQRVHRVPVMEDVEEDIEVSPAFSKTNVRTHFGFIAQDFEKFLSDNGLTTNDFAGFVKGEDGKRGLRYEQALVIMWPVLKALLDRVEKLENGSSA